ncbi:hypothetical protein SANTM175S_04931 [Streptomyces antimycoticus]
MIGPLDQGADDGGDGEEHGGGNGGEHVPAAAGPLSFSTARMSMPLWRGSFTTSRYVVKPASGPPRRATSPDRQILAAGAADVTVSSWAQGPGTRRGRPTVMP